MTTIVRTIEDSDIDEVAELTARVFGEEHEREFYREMTRQAYLRCPFMRKDLCWIAEVDGQIVAKWQVLDFAMRVGGEQVRMGGVQGVLAEPSQRNRGYPMEIARHAYPLAVAEGFDLVLGFAQRGGFYKRLGTVPVMADYQVRLEARGIPALQDDPFRELHDGDLARMTELYNASNATRTGTIVRSTEHWEWMVRRAPVVLMAPDGYIGVRFNESSLELREIGGANETFYDLALRKLGALARAGDLRRIQAHIPIDHPFVDVCRRHGCNVHVEYQRRSGCVAVLSSANLGAFLHKIGPEFERRLLRSEYTATGVHLTVHCDGSDASVALNPSAGRQEVLDLAVSPGTFLQLAFGYKPVRLALREKDVRLAPGKRNLLEALFPETHPFMWHTDRF